MRSKFSARIRGAGLLAERPRRCAPAPSPSNSRKCIGELAQTFGLHIERVLCASVRGGSTVIPNETNAPARVLQATGQYSICHWAFYICPFTRYVLVISPRALLKSVGYKAVGRLRGLEEGSGGVSMELFEGFWHEYPRKVGRIKAQRCWIKLAQPEKEQVMRGLRLWKQTVQWQSNGGTFIPYASTFLAQKRYLDEPWMGAFEEKNFAGAN